MSTPVILLPVDGSEHATRRRRPTLKLVGLMHALRAFVITATVPSR